MLGLSLLALVTGLLLGDLLHPAQGVVRAADAVVPLEGLLEQAAVESPQLLGQLVWAVVMILICTAIHLIVTVIVVLGYESPRLTAVAAHSSPSRILLIAATALVIFIAMVLEIIAWAVLFLVQGAVADLEQALYFSSVTFASLGYGDITLPIPFRVLASLEALVGILMAGWSTALLVTVAQRCFTLRAQRLTPAPESTAAPMQ